MMGQGFPVATHSSTTVLWRGIVTFWGPAMIWGLWRGLGPAPSWEHFGKINSELSKQSDGLYSSMMVLTDEVSLPWLTVSVASLLFKRLPMFVATHRYCPASSSWTLWIWRTPLGRTVILQTHKGNITTVSKTKARPLWIFVVISLLRSKSLSVPIYLSIWLLSKTTDVCRYLSVWSGNVLWLSSHVMAAGGLEGTAQEKRATDPSVTTTGTGCNRNFEIPVEKNELETKARTFSCLENLN